MASHSVLPAIPTKADLVYEHLRERILNGYLEPGQRISMDMVARELGVSKIPVREAIGRLVARGLVLSRQHAEPTVASVSAEQLRGVYLARFELEPFIARHAVATIEDSGIAVLERIQTSMRTCLEDNQLDALGDLNYQFHTAIAKATGFSIFVEFAESLLLAVRRHRVVDPLDARNWANVVTEHDAIVEAFRARDAERVTKATYRHVTSQADHDVSAAAVLDEGE